MEKLRQVMLPYDPETKTEESSSQFQILQNLLSPGETGNDVPGGYIEKERCIWRVISRVLLTGSHDGTEAIPCMGGGNTATSIAATGRESAQRKNAWQKLLEVI